MLLQTACDWKLLHQDWITYRTSVFSFGQPTLPQYAPNHAQQPAEGSAPESVGRSRLLAELALRIGMQWHPAGWVKSTPNPRLFSRSFDCISRRLLFIAAHETDHDLGNGNILLRMLTLAASSSCSPNSIPPLHPAVCATFALVYSTSAQWNVLAEGASPFRHNLSQIPTAHWGKSIFFRRI